MSVGSDIWKVIMKLHVHSYKGNALLFVQSSLGCQLNLTKLYTSTICRINS